LKNLQYPTEQLPAEYEENKNLAETMAGTGMPSEQYAMAMRNIQRQQLAMLREAKTRRGGLAVLPSLLRGTNDATLDLDAANAQQRVANQRTLMTVKDRIGGVKRDLFDKNIRDKYIRDYEYAMGLKGMGNQNLYGGADQAIGATTDYFGSKQKPQYTG